MASQKSSLAEERATRTPQRSRGRKRVSALLDAGVEVFAAAGYEAATMTEIAARAGASIGSLYQFFPTKEHLAAAIHARHLDALAAMLDALSAEADGAPHDLVVDQLFARLVAYLDANPAFLVLGERRSLDPAAKKAARARLRGGVARLLAAVRPPIAPSRIAPLSAVVLHLIRVAALIQSDDDASIRATAVAELQEMLRDHLGGRQDAAREADGAAFEEPSR